MNEEKIYFENPALALEIIEIHGGKESCGLLNIKNYEEQPYIVKDAIDYLLFGGDINVF